MAKLGAFIDEHVGPELEKKGVTEADIESVIEKGGVSAVGMFVDAFMMCLQQARNAFRIMTGGTRTTDEVIEAGNYGWTNDMVNGKNFPSIMIPGPKKYSSKHSARDWSALCTKMRYSLVSSIPRNSAMLRSCSCTNLGRARAASCSCWCSAAMAGTAACSCTTSMSVGFSGVGSRLCASNLGSGDLVPCWALEPLEPSKPLAMRGA
ncbi:MAG: hypothetical protein UX76_C0009G0025 [Candidatus Wolfebacteria bacterium GW2011_GWC1_47_103]|nr:MAG: hypothetical protein UX76_C0009G0025 [Candidatus Wolfebacteria bacterium GW2011_GWC1_47_103]